MANIDNTCKHLKIKNEFENTDKPLKSAADIQEDTQKMYFDKFGTIQFNQMNLRDLMNFWNVNNHAFIDEILESLDALGGIKHGTAGMYWKGLSEYSELEQTDLIELKFELVDQFHFLLNMWVSIGATGEELNKVYLEESSFEKEFPTTKFEQDKVFWLTSKLKLIEAIHIATDSLGGKNDGIGNSIWKTWKKDYYNAYNLSIKDISNDDYELLKMSILNIFDIFFNCWCHTGSDIKELYNMYISKNIENHDRQKRGY